MGQSQENVWTEGRKNGRRDRQTLLYRTLPAKTGGPTTSLQQVTGGNAPNPKYSTTQENITILRLK